jgi:hypothetical protein
VIQTVIACLGDGHRADHVSPGALVSPFSMKPLDLVIEPELDNPYEVGASSTPPPRADRTASCTSSRDSSARATTRASASCGSTSTPDGEPNDVERLGIALEPRSPTNCAQRRGRLRGPPGHLRRTPQVLPDDLHGVLARGPRIALAVSKDLLTWERLGLATFQPYEGIPSTASTTRTRRASPWRSRTPRACRAGDPAPAALPGHPARGQHGQGRGPRSSTCTRRASGSPTARCRSWARTRTS